MTTKYHSKPNIRKYAIVPARAVQDDDLHPTTFRTLAAICLHTNGHGIAWPSRVTLGLHINRVPDTITRQTRKLIKAGYIRKLKAKAYPVTRKSAHTWRTNRYQVMFEGPQTKLPTKEEFWSPRPAVAEEGPTPGKAVDNRGIQRVDTGKIQSLAISFCNGCARFGQHRIADQQLETAAVLVTKGVTATQVIEATTQCGKEWLAAGRNLPLTLKQVAEWAGLD